MYQIQTLADKALLVKLQRSMYSAYAYSPEATQLIEQSAGVQGAGRYNKRLFKNNLQLKETNEAFNILYTTYIKNTVPWLDDGVRMLPNAGYFQFAEEIRGLITKAKSAADKLMGQWEAMVLDDMIRLGSLANADDYPTALELRAKYDATIQFFPIPTTSDFRIEVTDDDKAAMAAAITDAENNVSTYLFAQMLEPITKFVSKLSIPIGQDGAVFRDTLVDNILELTERLPKLNINNDPTLNGFIQQLRDVVGPLSLDGLRESPAMRQSARDKMAAIQSSMASFMGQ